MRSLIAISALLAARVIAADPTPKDEVSAAAKKLDEQHNYSWKSTIEFGSFTGTTEGKLVKEGIIALTMTFGDNTTLAFIKGDKAAVKTGDEGWQSLDELASAAGTEPGPRQFLVRRLRNFKAPAVDIQDILGKTKEIKNENGAFSADLTETGAKDLLSFGGRGANAPGAKNAKGSLKLWIKDGLLSKYQTKVEGTMNFNGEDRDIDRTTTIEFKDAGTTKIEVPEAAQKKMS
ncbi:MAG TPA: hypothetical protein VL361_06960 [Candidatus Limnocylindrales bacterium]|jgi:hypothetical protein|nr:hypothetical protein [Candidatus Limnocylindrales bacterium]